MVRPVAWNVTSVGAAASVAATKRTATRWMRASAICEAMVRIQTSS